MNYKYSDVSYIQKTYTPSAVPFFFLGDEKFSHVFQFKIIPRKYNSLAYFMESNTKDVEAGKSKVLGHSKLCEKTNGHCRLQSSYQFSTGFSFHGFLCCYVPGFKYQKGTLE